MATNNFSITGHMLVKNEDQWVWFAISSVLAYVDHLHIIDTGSTDHTIQIIKSFSSKKIHFEQKLATSPRELSALRQYQLAETHTPWVWIVDGDEIYSDATAKECLTAIKSTQYEGLVVRRYDLLGDIYHRQQETVGSYRLFGHTGHLLIRLFNRVKLPGLHYAGDYPLEDLIDTNNNSLQTHDPKLWYTTTNYLYHAMYLKRSSLGGNLGSMFNRSKYKIETGISISSTFPAVFSLPRPSYVADPLVSRSLFYNFLATIITPFKQFKRKLFNYYNNRRDL
jgi:glycosyltransferase involved in cell wall biosynthesis